ncbi:tetratricopeptide repeat protein [Pontiellaceae bacterium B12227]|nr:tetratricopeptide repeat protein [Pontiellaceae bacterium B12227]
MKLFLSMCTALALSSLTAFAQQEQFSSAQIAYDAGRYAEAVLLYEKILDQGIANPEVHYNIANAYFKDSDLPKAVWHYQKAWYEMPRDPDVKANLHFALNAAGAIEAKPAFTERLLCSLSKSEWIIAATAGYLLLILLLLLLQVKTSRRLVVKLCLVPLGIILLSTFGWLRWNQLQTHPDWVVVKTEATALFGPVKGSTAHFKIPIGALVRQRSIDPKGWVEVEYDGKQGWLETEYISRISP